MSRCHTWFDSPGWSQRTSVFVHWQSRLTQSRPGTRWVLECHHVTKWSRSPGRKKRHLLPLLISRTFTALVAGTESVTWAPLSFTSSTDHLPSYWIQTKMPPSISQVASFWKGSFQRTKTTCKSPRMGCKCVHYKQTYWLFFIMVILLFIYLFY